MKRVFSAPAVLFLAAFSFYLFTMAPTVLWGDDAELQRLAWSGGEVSRERGGHHLWFLLARLFCRLPWGDPAWRVNLLSAFCAALSVGFVYLCALRLTKNPGPAVLGAGALAVSHTFWLHAVRAEVYSLHVLLLSVAVLLALRWVEDPRRKAFLGWACFLVGVGVSNHLMMLTLLPALIFLVVAVDAPSRWRAGATAAAAFVLGASPHFVMSATASGESPISQFALVQPLSGIPRDLILGAGFLLYQFPLSVILFPFGLVYLWRRKRAAAVFLALAYAGAAGFAFSFKVRDQYAFYLPSYVFMAILISAGAAALLESRPGASRGPAFAALMIAAVLVPMALYRITPVALNRLDVNLLGLRDLPGRDSNTYFFWPSKRGYLGARRFAEEVLEILPPKAVLLADWLPWQAIDYVRATERRREDVTIVEIPAGIGEQVPFLLEQSLTRPVFIADDEMYYDIDEIRKRFDVEPFDPILQLTRRE